MCNIVEFEPEYQEKVWKFLEKCLPESGRTFDLSGRHREYMDIGNNFEKFWCVFDGEAITGTVALKRMNDTEIELKSLYLLEKYHGRGLGRQLLETALKYAAEKEYKTILLDTKSSSEKAIRLYRKAGFVMTERYNNNENADVFMKLSI